MGLGRLSQFGLRVFVGLNGRPRARALLFLHIRSNLEKFSPLSENLNPSDIHFWVVSGKGYPEIFIACRQSLSVSHRFAANKLSKVSYVSRTSLRPKHGAHTERALLRHINICIWATCYHYNILTMEFEHLAEPLYGY